MEAQTDGAKLGQRRKGETLKGVNQFLNWKMLNMDARLEKEGYGLLLAGSNGEKFTNVPLREWRQDAILMTTYPVVWTMCTCMTEKSMHQYEKRVFSQLVQLS